MTDFTASDAVELIRELDLAFDEIYATRGLREVFVPGVTADDMQPRVDAWCASRGFTEGVTVLPDRVDLPGGGAADACRIKIAVRTPA